MTEGDTQDSFTYSTNIDGPLLCLEHLSMFWDKSVGKTRQISALRHTFTDGVELSSESATSLLCGPEKLFNQSKF